MPAAAQCRLPYRWRGSPRVRFGSDVRPSGPEGARTAAPLPNGHAGTSPHYLGGTGAVPDSVFGVGMSASPLRRLPFIPITGTLYSEYMCIIGTDFAVSQSAPFFFSFSV